VDYHALGRTGLRVAPIALGTGSIGEMFGPASVAEAVRVVHWAIDHGINLIDTSTYYGSAEERLGIALAGRRDSVVLATKAGRFGFDDFDFSPRRIRRSLEHSLTVMKTDFVDVFHLHDVENVPIDRVLTDGFATLQQLKEEGKCRFVGMTGYPLRTIERVIRETDVDVVLNYAGATLLDSSLTDHVVPLAAERGVGVISAAAVALGLLTPSGTNILIEHPATPGIIASADRMRSAAAERGVDISFVANQFAVQRSRAATTVVGTSKIRHLESAIRAAEEPIDVALEAELLALRPPIGERRWTSGLPENN
jgi:L-galactose dehydrogenase